MRCFIVRDSNGQALAYVYFEEKPGPDPLPLAALTSCG
jgi:hypothetical protein